MAHIQLITDDEHAEDLMDFSIAYLSSANQLLSSAQGCPPAMASLHASWMPNGQRMLKADDVAAHIVQSNGNTGKFAMAQQKPDDAYETVANYRCPFFVAHSSGARGSCEPYDAIENEFSDVRRAAPVSIAMPMRIFVPTTTLMVRNIGGHLRQEQALRLWPASPGDYDLFYMPYDTIRGRTAGYAFVNFVTPEVAMAFRARVHGRLFPDYLKSAGSSGDAGSTRRQIPIEIRAADRQGFDANIDHWKNTLLQLPDHTLQPAVFLQGRRFAFWQLVQCMVYLGCEKASDVEIASDLYSM